MPARGVAPRATGPTRLALPTCSTPRARKACATRVTVTVEPERRPTYRVGWGTTPQLETTYPDGTTLTVDRGTTRGRRPSGRRLREGSTRDGRGDQGDLLSGAEHLPVPQPAGPAADHGPQTTTSNHLGGVGIMWGNGPISGTANTGKDMSTTTATKLECTACHDPHGNGQYRILRAVPSDSGFTATLARATPRPASSSRTRRTRSTRRPTTGSPATPTPWPTPARRRSSEEPPPSDPTPVQKTIANPVSSFQANVAAWCTTCHTRYLAPSGSWGTNSGDAVFTYRHTGDNVGGTNGDAASNRNCIQCHVAHGSNAQMPNSKVEWPNGTTTQLRQPSAPCGRPRYLRDVPQRLTRRTRAEPDPSVGCRRPLTRAACSSGRTTATTSDWSTDDDAGARQAAAHHARSRVRPALSSAADRGAAHRRRRRRRPDLRRPGGDPPARCRRPLRSPRRELPGPGRSAGPARRRAAAASTDVATPSSSADPHADPLRHHHSGTDPDPRPRRHRDTGPHPCLPAAHGPGSHAVRARRRPGAHALAPAPAPATPGLFGGTRLSPPSEQPGTAPTYLPAGQPLTDLLPFETFRVVVQLGNGGPDDVAVAPRLEYRMAGAGTYLVVPRRRDARAPRCTRRRSGCQGQGRHPHRSGEHDDRRRTRPSSRRPTGLAPGRGHRLERGRDRARRTPWRPAP